MLKILFFIFLSSYNSQYCVVETRKSNEVFAVIVLAHKARKRFAYLDGTEYNETTPYGLLFYYL